MADHNQTAAQFSYLDQLAPNELFQLLVNTARKHSGLLPQNMRILLPEIVPFQFVTLEVPDPLSSAGESSPDKKECFKTLIAEFKELTGRGELFHSPGGDAGPMLEGLASILINTTATPGHRVLQGTENQYMVITSAITDTEAEKYFKSLSFHATATRVCCIESSAGSRYLFLVKDDPRRKSSFQSVSSSGMFDECQILKGYELEGQTTFLPRDTNPDEAMLKHFGHLVEAAPLMFSQRQPEQKDLTAAVAQWPDPVSGLTGRIEFWHLAGLRFHGEEQFTGRKVEHAEFSYMDLEGSQAGLDRLARAIKEAEPFVGYRLELRTTRYMDKNSLERLNEQKARIEYNLAYLQSISKPRPMLMRFSQRQLPAMAAEIRSFPIHVILDGHLKYGYHAINNNAGGFHYLLIDPSRTARLELDPYPLWQGFQAEHMRFRMDPFWANHYFDAGSQGEAMVFVPEGTTLYPPLHAWDKGSMDHYLRETMSHWFETRTGGQTIPQAPVYIFDGVPQPRGEISISVLDYSRMEPLHTRLGWLNDNLLINRTIEKENLMAEMARDITWTQMAQQVKVGMEETRRDFEESALLAARNMSLTTAEMTNVMSSEINRLVRDTYRIVERIRRTEHHLKEWDEVCKDMEDVLQDIRQKRQSVTSRQGEAKNEFWRFEQEVQKELAVADTRRKEINQQLEDELKKMKITNMQIKRRLKSFKL